MGVWIGQEWHERQQLDERARPAVNQNQRNAVPVSGPLMDEVDVNAVELCAELSGRVQLALLCLPIELVGPIRKQLPKVLKVSPLLPSSAWCLFRPARLTNALSEVRQDLCLDLDRERGDM
jgi:hypothetical protein